MRRDLEQTRKFFQKDSFAVNSGISIDEVGEGYARCSMKVQKMHTNVRGTVMGGAIFTLADLCYGAASDAEAVSMSSDINFLNPATGPVLYAEARLVRGGKTTVFYEVNVTDGEKIIAFVTMRGYKV